MGNMPPTLSASEVGRYVYCARAWWLQRVHGLQPANQEALDMGRQRHQAHGQSLATAQRQVVWVRWLLVLALLLGIVLIYTLWQR
jgi:hypothetical protein